MTYSLYSLKNVKLDRFQPPIACRDDVEARYQVSHAGFSKVIYDDLDLFFVGTFDEVTGQIVPDFKRVGLDPLPGGVSNE